MFPIWDARGKVIGFGARALGDEQPKYINTSETAVFSKGRNFYGLHMARESLEASRRIHIVEGYFDVILPYQEGVRGLVATLGTALTRDHLKVLRRYVDKVVLVFDGDAAGRRANERGLDLLLAQNMDLFVASLPDAQDPCDVVVSSGAKSLRDFLEKRMEIFEFLVTSLTAKHGKAKALSILAHKLGRAVYYMLQRREAFDMKKFLSS
jgi:DNA primase